MLSNFEILTTSSAFTSPLFSTLPPRVEKGYFGFSFLSWQGNEMTFADSKWLVYLFYAIIVVSCFMIFIFKTNLQKNYQKNKKIIIGTSQLFGIFLFSIFIFRIVILTIGGYPNLWELVPLHFCRMFVLIISIFLILRKMEFIKYFAILAILGAVIGLLIPDLANSAYWTAYGGMEIGLDNYVFWDFFIIHGSSVIFLIFALTSMQSSFSKKEMSYTILSMCALVITVFFLNMILDTVSDSKWKSNWFYLGKPENNGIDDFIAPFLGPLSSYPTILFTFIVIGIIAYISSTMLYIVSDKIQFIWWDEKIKKITFKVKIVPSENYKIFKDDRFVYRNKYNL